MTHVVIANETVAGRALTDALERRAAGGGLRVSVVCPVNAPREVAEQVPLKVERFTSGSAPRLAGVKVVGIDPGTAPSNPPARVR